MRLLHLLDRWLAKRGARDLILLALVGVALVGYVDHATGYEISVGLFYLAPVSLAAWYVGCEAGIAMALTCSIAWFIAATGHGYSHPAIQSWNALIRFGFFLSSGLLLSGLRSSLEQQQTLARTDSLTGLLTRRAF